MKIIGRGSGGSFIVEMDSHELAKLVGFQYSFDRDKEPAAGAEVHINPMYDKLYRLADREKELEDCRQRLIKLADQLAPLGPIVALREPAGGRRV